MTTWRKATAEQAIRAEAETGLAWAKYDANGQRISQGCNPTAEQLAQWDAEAPAQAVIIFAEHVAAETARKLANRGIAAKYAGTCAKSGQRYGKGARIEHTQFGWALVGAELDVSYNMDREDSPL